MTDELDPTMRSRDSWTGPGDASRDPGFTVPDDTTMHGARSRPDELPSTAQDPAEGGRDEVSDLPGAETAEEPFPPG